MVTEDRVHPARRAETGERPRPFLERDRPSFVAVIGHVVAEQSDQIWLESIGCGNDRAHMIRGHERTYASPPARQYAAVAPLARARASADIVRRAAQKVRRPRRIRRPLLRKERSRAPQLPRAERSLSGQQC